MIHSTAEQDLKLCKFQFLFLLNIPPGVRNNPLSAAVWPNGEGIGFRSRGLQVRVLPGSYEKALERGEAQRGLGAKA